MKFQVAFLYTNGDQRIVDIEEPTKFSVIKALLETFPERLKAGLIIKNVFIISIDNVNTSIWELK